jgi:hypothetical protein
MADLFRDRSCMHWWLPNDENYPPIIRSIRKFVEERTSPALNLDDGTSSIPPNVDKGKSSSAGVTVAAGQDSYIQSMGNIAPAEGDVYGLGFDDGQGYWDEGRGGGM